MAAAPQQVTASLQPYFDKGIQAYSQGSHEYAIDLLAYVIRQSPDATEARRYLRLATQKYNQQHPPSLISRFALLMMSIPLRLWAGLCAMQGQYGQAIQLYERLLLLQPRSRGLRMQLATALSRAHLEDATLATYEELLSVDPNHLPALRKMARLCMRRSDDVRARQCFERLISLAPNDLEAQQGLRNLDALGTIKKGFTT